MEHAPLRPVPSRPTGPVDPGTAKRFVAAWLPGLSDDQATALALVALAGHAPTEAGLSRAQAGATLAAARKELRRSLRRLPGSGWCERAERLISDCLDGELVEPNAARLDVHLRNCPRCVEHERMLVHATDALVAAFVEEHGVMAVKEERGGAAELTVVGPDAEPEEAAAEETMPEEAAAEETMPEEAAAEEAMPDEAAPEEAAPEETAPAPDEVVPLAQEVRSRRDLRTVLSAVTWNVLLVIAILLTLASIGLTVAGILGAGL
jgi:hypothetical protein